MSHEIFYQLRQITFLEIKKRCYNVYWQHCVWRSVLSPSPWASSGGLTLYRRWGNEPRHDWKLYLQCLVESLHFAGSHKSLWTWSLSRWSFTFCLLGHKREQKMSRAWTKHPVVSFTNSLGWYYVVCFRVSRSRLFLWKYKCQNQGHTINITIFISMVSAQTIRQCTRWCPETHRMLFGVLV